MKTKIKQLKKKLDKAKPRGWAHGCQLSRAERIVKSKNPDKEDLEYAEKILNEK